MKGLRILAVCVFILTYSAIAASDYVPVLIYDHGDLNGVVASQLDPFAVVGHEELDNIMPKIEAMFGTIIFFIEEYFSLEDLSARDENGTAFSFQPFEARFKNNSSDNKVVFLQVFDPYGYIHSRYPAFDKPAKFGGKYIVIQFEDYQNETRIERLRRHQALIGQIFLEFKSRSEERIVAIYFGKKMAEFKVPQTPARAPAQIIKFNCYDANFEFYGFKMSLYGVSLPVMPSFNVLMLYSSKVWRYQLKFNCQVDGVFKKYELEFVIRPIDLNDKARGWNISEITYSAVGKKLKKLKTLNFKHRSQWNVWFSCTKPLNIKPDELQQPELHIRQYKIKLDREQMWQTSAAVRSGGEETSSHNQPGSSNQTEGNGMFVHEKKYSAPWWESDEYEIFKRTEEPEVQTLVTPGILMGLLVFALIFFVYLWGLGYMLTLETNSKYDSQDCKPLFDPETIKD